MTILVRLVDPITEVELAREVVPSLRVAMQGPAGPPGAAGEAGPEGPEGPEGPQGPPGDPGGPPGPSAYDVAVAAGFVGTEVEWLASLVGPPGADGADGAAGAPGADGADGSSAYELAVASGFVGTLEAWLASLVGPAGAEGSDGAPGADGADGAPGADGADGASAYEVAVAAGFVGTAEEWLASLVGPAGTDGADGADGPPGEPGAGVVLRGLRGFSATDYYELASAGDLAGNDDPGFTVIAAVVIDLVRGIAADMQVIAGTTGQFDSFGSWGYRVAFNGQGPRHVITDGTPTRLSNSVGNWIDAATQPKVLAVLSLSFDGTTRRLASFGSSAFAAAMTGYTPSSFPFRVGCQASNGSEPLTGASLVALGAKTDGVLSDADYAEQVHALLTTGDFVNGSLTSRWSIRDLPEGAAPSTLEDVVGANDLTLEGALIVRGEAYTGAAICSAA